VSLDHPGVTREDRLAVMARGKGQIDETIGAGALVVGFLGSLLIWLTFGDGLLARWAWLVIAVGLLLATEYLGAPIARPLAAACYPLGVGLLGLLAALLLLAPGAVAYMFSRWVVETLPRWLQVTTLVVWVLLLALVSVLLYSRALRERVRLWLTHHRSKFLQAFSWRADIHAWGAVLLYINFVIIAMGCFASVAFLLHGLTPPLFLPKARPVEHGTLADFLLWHVLDAIPGLKVPETIKWEAPLTYERASAGWLLLLFKVMVIVPVVSGIGHYLTEEDDEPDTKSAPPPMRGSVAPSE
jgi:hypothetical protein